MELTIETLLLALQSVRAEIKKHELLTQDPNASDEEISEYGQYVLDLSRAHAELGDAYERARQPYPEYPPYATVSAE